MNFIATPNPMKIAVIGGGISGMGAAYQLSKFGNVTLFESAGRLGGHARTVFAGKRGDKVNEDGGDSGGEVSATEPSPVGTCPPHSTGHLRVSANARSSW